MPQKYLLNSAKNSRSSFQEVMTNTRDEKELQISAEQGNCKKAIKVQEHLRELKVTKNMGLKPFVNH